MSKPREWWIGYDELDRMHAFDTKVAADSFYKAIYHEGSVHHVIEYASFEKLLEDNRRMAETLNWIMPKVHQGNHEGPFDECPKTTCTAYREALTAHEQTMKDLE